MRVDIDGISKSYTDPAGNPLHVVGGLTASIEQGEFVCIIGPSGCGKSTLLGMLGGLLPPDEGAIRFSGTRTATGEMTSIVWQDHALIPWRSIIDNVAFGLELRGMGRRERKEIAQSHLETMGIGAFANARPQQLSGGMRQRAGIARALASDPEVLLMDEPFAAVDAQTRTLLQEELLAVWERHRKTVVFITHGIEEALLLADRVLVLSGRPTHVVEDLRVPFPRPRTADIAQTPEFGELKQHLWERLRDATRAAEWAEVEGAGS
ncbi:ABC transporter ATP-binding protein [Homoserinibacter sp. GY 40078]|uniref:ABC transporter ATP-binding protein n=1 Tax=Homoserinibacter sp. GY 40078 TaxID=2603275 RepID=UPI0011C73304|nr:ABC transporter ATP-binding protein [Homoserinibacter sp. GY 40078]TXK18674.1 ABC transporter ATP-binding protein [Homoserinibacter sp. GY 40078]